MSFIMTHLMKGTVMYVCMYMYICMCRHKIVSQAGLYILDTNRDKLRKKEGGGGGGEEGDLLDLQRSNACCYIHICTLTLCIYKHASWSVAGGTNTHIQYTTDLQKVMKPLESKQNNTTSRRNRNKALSFPVITP